AALATSLIVASYTVTDGIGARLSGSPYAYSTWLFLLYGIFMPMTYLLARRTVPSHWASKEALTALAAGVVQLVTYVVVIWAFTLNPIGPISALRETSIIFAALIGRIFLKETLTFRRLGGCIVTACGAFCLGYRL